MSCRCFAAAPYSLATYDRVVQYERAPPDSLSSSCGLPTHCPPAPAADALDRPAAPRGKLAGSSNPGSNPSSNPSCTAGRVPTSEWALWAARRGGGEEPKPYSAPCPNFERAVTEQPPVSGALHLHLHLHEHCHRAQGSQNRSRAPSEAWRQTSRGERRSGRTSASPVPERHRTSRRRRRSASPGPCGDGASRRRRRSASSREGAKPAQECAGPRATLHARRRRSRSHSTSCSGERTSRPRRRSSPVHGVSRGPAHSESHSGRPPADGAGQARSGGPPDEAAGRSGAGSRVAADMGGAGEGPASELALLRQRALQALAAQRAGKL